MTYLLTPWSRVLIEKLTDSQLVNKFPAFYGTRRFITAFKSARQLSLFSASSIQSVPPHPTSWRSILLSSHLRLGLPSGLFPSGFLTKNLYMPLLTPIRATCPAHLILLDFITRTILGEEYRSLSSSLCRIHNEELNDIYLHYSHHFNSTVLLLNVSTLKGPSSGSMTDTFSQQDQQICTTCKIQLIEQRVIFVDLAVETYLSYSPKDGPLKAETCSSNIVLIHWCE